VSSVSDDGVAFAGEVLNRTPGVGFGLGFTDLNPEQKLFVHRILRK
jgi:hypothetical protein